MTTVEKPRGSYTNLMDEPYTKVKKIVIKPGEAPSYQYHFKRSEIWVIVMQDLFESLNLSLIAV